MQTLPSLQSLAAPEQVPPLHVSLTVQYRPSSHATVLFTWAQVSPASLHESVVQTLESAQSRSEPSTCRRCTFVDRAVQAVVVQLTAVPAWQPSPVSQLSTPLQYRPSSQTSGVWLTPVSGSQASVVQASPSSITTAACRQVSPVQSQLSVVQAFESSQLTAVPAWQPSPVSQLSTPLQYRPSSQTSGVWLTPVSGSQASVVQASPSSITTAACRQVSPASSQLSFVQAFESLQLTAVPAWQPSPVSQLSTPLQYRPSSQTSGVLGGRRPRRMHPPWCTRSRPRRPSRRV